MGPPKTVAHADWSKDPRKRYVAHAYWRDGRYVITEPVRANGFPDAAFVGFDFPIGVPTAWARLAGVESYTDALKRWPAEFYEPCATRDQICLERPFYPARPGGTSPRHLEAVFGPDRLRRCDRVAKAAEIFWLIGAKHPGHAAIAGWRDMLAPMLRNDSVVLWPFDASLQELFKNGKTVVAECYPAEVYRWLGIPRNFSKRSRERRAAQAPLLRRWAAEAGVEIEADAESGFPSDDAFDAVIGLIGMLEVVLGRRPACEPEDSEVRQIEGWILGLDATDRTAG